MKKNLRLITLAAAGAFLSLGFVSCAYDPYYSSSVGGSYGSGYSGGNYSTSLFVGTGDPRWGYDPSCYSYYDYSRRSYYDPYLYGYYPVGYRPSAVYGVPHPYGWRPGSGICRPPGRVTNVTISNYRDRVSSYRGSRYGWAEQVRQGPGGYDNSSSRYSPSRGRENQSYESRPNSDYRPSTNYRPTSEPSYRGGEQRSESSRPDFRGSSGSQGSSRYPSQYNRPVSDGSSVQSPSYQGRGSSQRQAGEPAFRQPSTPRSEPGSSSRSENSGRGSQSDYGNGGESNQNRVYR